MCSCVLFIVVTIVNIHFNLRDKLQSNLGVSIDNSPHHLQGKTLFNAISHNHLQGKTLFNAISHNHLQRKTSFKIVLPESISQRFFESFRKTRVSIMNNLGMSSINIRLKAIEVSLINSLPNIWLGNGAGTSQKLLPRMATDYDKTIDRHSELYIKMLKSGMLGVAAQWGIQPAISEGISENNVTLIDSHNLFLTELFNVGIIGVLSLLLMICLILYEQIKVIKKNNKKNIILNVLLFATLLSILTHRMTASFVVIPFLWFILGLNLGIIRLPFSSQER
jgi:hypothetical protein